ncbi:MAG TPA: hypothetical protein VKZ75_12145 [Cyclobacteriaceae bacterium]|nr:hypothetical protein [Cyclobacteriaceae bacterium]
MRELIKIKPELGISFSCPECRSGEVTVSRVFTPGIYWLANCKCSQCGISFHQSLPTGHMLDHPLAINTATHRLYPDDWNMWWQSDPFRHFCTTVRKDDISIRKIVHAQHRKVIILNAIDFLYGHSLLKLYNALHYIDNYKDAGLIVLIPAIFEWLVPDGCAEVWAVDLGLGRLRDSYEAIERFVAKESERFDEISVSTTFNHPDFTRIDISRFTGVRPFDVDKFYDYRPCFTFALREDRWWVKSPLSNFTFRVARKLGLTKLAGKILVAQQDRLVKRTIRKIRQEIPEAEFFITGLGKAGSLARLASDQRTTRMNPDVEREWCRIYAKSHVIIGAHGSNMLLPTAHAAACVEVLMEERNRNIVQDLSVRYNDRRQLFFYRFADQYASPSSIAVKAVGIYKNYENCYRNMVLNQYD